MVGVSLNNPTKADDKEQLVETDSSDVLVTVIVSRSFLDETLELCFSSTLAHQGWIRRVCRASSRRCSS